jgi:hypothetical protein
MSMGRRNKRHRIATVHRIAVEDSLADFNRKCRAAGMSTDEFNGLWHVRQWRRACAAARGALAPKYDRHVARLQAAGLPAPAPEDDDAPA